MKLSKPLFWLITLLWFIAGIWWYSLSPCSTCGDQGAPIDGSSAITGTLGADIPPFSIKDGSWSLFNPNNIRFGKAAAIPVIASRMHSSLDSLAAYTEGNGKHLVVTGYYDPSEVNNTEFENLGLARAEALKKELIAKGIPAELIRTEAKERSNLTFSPPDTLQGGVSFAFETPEKAKEELLFQSRTVYFNTAQNSFPVDSEMEKYINDVTEYLKAHPDKKLAVTGYADNTGSSAVNLRLSASRAEFVKNQLTRHGVPASQIVTEGKGEANPIADNSTAEGRSKNRRVTITLQ